MSRREPILAAAAPASQKPSSYPAPFAALVAGRERRRLGDLFGLKNLGVNLTRLPPGVQSALHHRHTRQDELIYVLEGEVTLVTDGGEHLLGPGCCAGFPAGGEAHHVVNRSSREAVYLEVGDRTAGDDVIYPRDDLALTLDADGKPRAAHKDGTLY